MLIMIEYYRYAPTVYYSVLIYNLWRAETINLQHIHSAIIHCVKLLYVIGWKREGGLSNSEKY